jgi:hypothetical protein
VGSDGESSKVIWVRKNRNIFAKGAGQKKLQGIEKQPDGQISAQA